jgi:hypothetical protein
MVLSYTGDGVADKSVPKESIICGYSQDVQELDAATYNFLTWALITSTYGCGLEVGPNYMQTMMVVATMKPELHRRQMLEVAQRAHSKPIRENLS